MPRLPHLALCCALGLGALSLTACGGSAAESAADAKHPSWPVVAQIVCPDGGTGSVAEHKLTCQDAKGKPLEASFYEQVVDLDRRVSTHTCTNGVKSVAGKDWIVPAITDEAAVSKLLDAGGINLC